MIINSKTTLFYKQDNIASNRFRSLKVNSSKLYEYALSKVDLLPAVIPPIEVHESLNEELYALSNTGKLDIYYGDESKVKVPLFTLEVIPFNGPIIVNPSDGDYRATYKKNKTKVTVAAVIAVAAIIVFIVYALGLAA